MDARRINFLIKLSDIVSDADSLVQDDLISSSGFPTIKKCDETEVSGSTSSKCLIEEIVDSDHGNPEELIKPSSSSAPQTAAEVSYRPKIQTFNAVSEKKVPLQDFELPCSSKTDFSSIRNRKKHPQKTMFHSKGVENNIKETNGGNCSAGKGKVHPKSGSRMSSGKGLSGQKGVNRKNTASASNMRNFMNDVHDPSEKPFLKKPRSEKEIAIYEMAKRSKERAREMAAKELGYVRDSAFKDVTDPSLKDVDLDYSYMTDFERMLETTLGFPLSFYSPEILECGIDDSSSSSEESSLFFHSWFSEDSDLDLKSIVDDYNSFTKPSDPLSELEAKYLKDLDIYLEYLEYCEIMRNLEQYMNKDIKRLPKLTRSLKDPLARPRSKVKLQPPTKTHSLNRQQFVNHNSGNTSDSSTNTTSDTQILNVIKAKKSQNTGNPTDAHTLIKGIEKDETCVPIPPPPNHPGEIISHYSKDKYVSPNTSKAYGEKGGMINKDENCVPMLPSPNHPGEIISLYDEDKYFSPSATKACREKSGVINEKTKMYQMPKREDSADLTTQEHLNYSKLKPKQTNDSFLTSQESPKTITKEPRAMFLSHCKLPKETDSNNPIILQPRKKAKAPNTLKTARNMLKKLESEVYGSRAGSNYSNTTKPNEINTAKCKGKSCIDDPVVSQASQKAEAILTAMKPSMSSRNFLEKLDPSVAFSHDSDNHSSTVKTSNTKATKCESGSYKNNSVILQASQKTEAISTAVEPLKPSQNFLEKLEAVGFTPRAGNSHSNPVEPNKTETAKCEKKICVNNFVISQATQKDGALSTAVKPLKSSRSSPKELEPTMSICHEGITYSSMLEPNKMKAVTREVKSDINMPVIPQSAQKPEAVSTAVKPFMSLRNFPEELKPASISHGGSNTEQKETKAAKYEEKSYINNSVIPQVAQKAKAISTAVKPLKPPQSFLEKLEPVMFTSYAGINHSNIVESNKTETSKCERKSDINIPVIPQAAQKAEGISTAVKPSMSCPEELEPTVSICHDSVNYSSTLERSKGKAVRREKKSDITMPVIPYAAQKGISTTVKSLMSSRSFPEELDPTVSTSWAGNNHLNTLEPTMIKAINYERELQLLKQLDKNGTNAKLTEAKPQTFTSYISDSASQLSITPSINSENKFSCYKKNNVGRQENDTHSQDIHGEFQNNVEPDEENDIGPNLRLSTSTKPQYLSKEIFTAIPQVPTENTETIPYPLEDSFDKSAEQFSTTLNAPIAKFVYQDLSSVRFYNTKFNTDPSESHEQNSQMHKSLPKPASGIAEKVRNLRDRYAKGNLKTLFRAEKENFTKKIISAGNFLQSKYPSFGAKPKTGEERCKQDVTKGYAVNTGNDTANMAQADMPLSSKTETNIKDASSDCAHLNKDNLYPYEVKKTFKPHLTPLQSKENIKSGSR